MAASEAQKRAVKKHDDKFCKILTFKAKNEFAAELDKYIEKNGIKSRQYFILQCLAKCIKEGYIPDDGN